MTPTAPAFDPTTVTRPHERLLTHYFVLAHGLNFPAITPRVMGVVFF